MAPRSAKLRSIKVPTISQREQILVLGCDPGTTSFKFAALEAFQVSDGEGNILIDKDPYQQIIPLSHFPGFERIDSNTVPTALVYNKEGDLMKWGHHAVNFQTDNRFDPDYFVAYWKLGLHTSSSQAARHLRRSLEALAQRLEITPEKFIEDFFRAVSQFVLDNENSPLLEHLGGGHALQEFKYVDVVIALPPGWPRQEHRTFTTAATQGLGNNRQLRIFTVSETESILNQWITEPRHRKKVKVRDVIMLLDLGGGTACISVFRCIAAPPMNEKFRWEHVESHSLTAGSQIVTEGFIADFQSRLDEAGIPFSTHLHHRVRKEFDAKKLSIGEETPERDWSIDVDGLKRDDRKGLGNGKIWFTGEQLLGYFQISQDQILEKAHEVMTRVPKEESISKFCVVAGAYGNNVIFKGRLKAMNSLENFGMDINYPNYGGEAVVRGACLTRVEGEFSQLTGSRYSVAILIYVPWSEVMENFPDAAVMTFEGDNQRYSPVLEWKIKKGDPLKANNMIAAHSDLSRDRLFSDNEDIIFHDTIYTSECHPGQDLYTYLKRKTNNPVDWKLNEIDLLERGIEVKAFEVTWDLRNTNVLQDGSYKPLPREALPRNRVTEMRCLNYKYHINVGQIDVKLYIESFFTKKRRDMMAMSHKQIILMDEPESAILAQEYEHLPDLMESANHEDGYSLVRKVPVRDAHKEQDLSGCYSPKGLESESECARRQRQTQNITRCDTSQPESTKDMAKYVAFTATEQARSNASVSLNKDLQGGVVGPRKLIGSRELPADRLRTSTQGPHSRISPSQVNPAEREPESQSILPLANSSPSSLRRPKQETLDALRVPVVESRKREFWAITGSWRNSKHTINPFR